MRVYAACHPELGDHLHEATFVCSCGAHTLKVAWKGGNGTTHIDDHDGDRHRKQGHPILGGCDNECTDYKLVAGEDPFSAPTQELEDFLSGGGGPPAARVHAP